MKVSGIGSLQSIGSVKSTSAPSEAGRSANSSGATTVSMSSDAAWIESLRAESQKLGPIRSEVVAETRAQLNAGTFEQSVDLDSLVDSLLADF